MSANNLRDWTVMVYFSADNDLQDEAFNNLSQMVEVGGSDNVHVLAQIVSRGGIPTRRYFMHGPNDAEATDVEGETNVGSIDDLLSFVNWASSGEHRAKNYLIVLWGHANGIFDDEDDVGTAKLNAEIRAGSKLRGEAGEFKKPSDRSFLALTGVDSALTSFELKEAFKRIQEMLGQKVAILGLDACLMSMAEIAKQVSGSVGLMVASEEAIPDKSWPYDRVLQTLVETTKVRTVEPEELAKLIVDEYISSYQTSEDPVTLSACRLEKIDDLAGALDELGRALTDLLENDELRKAVSKARRETQMFLFREYVDLFDFCERLLDTLQQELGKSEQGKAAKRAAEEMIDVIGRNGGAESDFVFHCGGTSGKGGILERAHGVSIYFPPLPSTYADLDLSKHTHWNNFVHGYMNAVFLSKPVIEIDRKNGRSPQGPKPQKSSESLPPAKTSQPVAVTTPDSLAGNGKKDQPAGNGEKARLLLPKGTCVRDLLGEFEETLTDQAFLMIREPAEIKVPEGTELDMPKKGNVKASTGTSTKASTGTSTKASTGTSTKAIRTVDGNVSVGCLDVPMCILNKAFSGGETRKLRNGTRIYPPRPAKGETEKDVEPIIVINEVKFVVDKPEIYEEKPALKGRAQANY
jgi:Clostripain family